MARMISHDNQNNPTRSRPDCANRAEAQKAIATLRNQIDYMAERHGNAVFLLSPETNQRTSYRQLAQRANKFSCKLLTQGLTPGDKVASLLDNGLFSAEWLLGTMYGGFVPVPLNPSFSANTIKQLLENSEAKIFFVSKEHLNLVRGIIPRHMHIEVVEYDDVIASDAEPEARLPALVRGEDDALLVYTSGSTGRPKGVVVSHRNLIAGGQNTVNAHQLTEQDCSLCVLPLYHMNAQVITLIATLLSGGSVVVPRHFMVASFWNWVFTYRCTWFALVPSLISQLVKAAPPDKLREDYTRVRFARSSSAPLHPSLLQMFEEKFDLPLIEAMGTTEAGGAIFSNPLPPAYRKVGSPGLPWGFECRVVGQGGKEIQNGSTGEILVRGLSIMKRYFKDPEATAEILDSDGWLCTGDLGYKDDDGFVFIQGRSKELINRGGEKIAPREIDEWLTQHPAVHEAAAIAVPDRVLGVDMVACIVLNDNASCTEDDLLEFCRSGLGIVKTPSRIHFLDKLPQGPTGKVQRLKLANWLSTSMAETLPSNVGTANNFPLTKREVEKKLIDLWSAFLKCKRVQTEDNFFELGGNSLLAIRMLSKLRKCFNVELPLSFFFEHPTIISQTVLIAHMGKKSRSMIENTSHSSERKKIFSLSAGQQKLLFLQRMYPNNSAYNEPEAFHLEGPIDLVALKQAIEAIMARHEMLRTTIEDKSGVPVQVVHRHLALELRQIDLSRAPEGEREEELRSMLTTQVRQPFDLNRQLLRAVLIRLTTNEHVLLLVLHHLVCDGWSMGILHRELSHFYLAFKTKTPPSLKPLLYQYESFVAHEHTRLADTGATERDLAYWTEQLLDAPTLLTLPTDRPRPAIFSQRGATVPVRIDLKLTQKMRQMAQREKVSLFTVVAATFNTFLFRYSGQPDLILGLPITRRNKEEFTPLIGMFVDTVILRSDLSGDPSFSNVLVKVGVSIRQALRHWNVPFDSAIERKDFSRLLGRSSLFQVMLNWRPPEARTSLLCLDGLRIKSMEVDRETSRLPLTFTLTDTGKEIMGHMEFSTDLWNPSTIGRMLNHYNTLLKAIVENPVRPISKFPLLTEPEQYQLLTEWNDTSHEFPRDKCIHEWFEEQVARTPDSIAVKLEEEQLTYQELNSRANKLANYLKRLGVGSEVLVGLFLPRSLNMVIGLLGILKAGGAYVPLDPDYPSNRLAFMLEDTQITIVVTQAHLLSKMPLHTSNLICLDRDWNTITQEQSSNPTSGATQANSVYVIYTSGSTGRPKGVVLRHWTLSNLIHWQIITHRTFHAAKTIQFASLGFDVSCQEIFSTWCSGGTLVLVADSIKKDFVHLLQVLEQEAVDRAFLPFVALQELARIAQTQTVPPSKICEVITAGEQLRITDSIASVFRHWQDGRLINHYGPSESHVVTSYTLEGSPDDWPSLPPIGSPIDNTQVYLLDPHLKPVPIGVIGEIYITGEGLARGYLHQPAGTAEKFRPNPYGMILGQRMYQTGDQGRFRADSTIEFLGRIDRQIKIRGFRIELGEIESALRQDPTVLDVVVLSHERTQGIKQLVAYLILKPDVLPDFSALNFALKTQLPDYMIPTNFMVLESFPLTINGKLNQQALPEFDLTRPSRSTPVDEPRTPLEKELVRIWSLVLTVEHVGIQDNFFELGGHSLLATQVIARLRNVLAIDIPLRVLFEHPTIAQLAKEIDQQLANTFPDYPKDEL